MRRHVRFFPTRRGGYHRVLGNLDIDARSTEGQILVQLMNELVENLGHKPTVSDRIMIEWVLGAHQRLSTLRMKADWTPAEMRNYALLGNAYRAALDRLRGTFTRRSVFDVAVPPELPSLAKLLNEHGVTDQVSDEPCPTPTTSPPSTPASSKSSKSRAYGNRGFASRKRGGAGAPS